MPVSGGYGPKGTKEAEETVGGRGETMGLGFLNIWWVVLRTQKGADLRSHGFQQSLGHFGYMRLIRQDSKHSKLLKFVFPILAMFYTRHHPECCLLFRTSCLFSSV